MATDDQHPLESQRQASSNDDKRVLRPSRTPNNRRGVSGSGSLSTYMLLMLLPTLVGGALLVKRLLQMEPYSLDRWEAPSISSPQKDKN